MPCLHEQMTLPLFDEQRERGTPSAFRVCLFLIPLPSSSPATMAGTAAASMAAAPSATTVAPAAAGAAAGFNSSGHHALTDKIIPAHPEYRFSP